MPDKYQDEIEEILKGLGERTRTSARNESEKPVDDAPLASRQAPPDSRPRPGGGRFWPAVTPSKLAVLGLVFLLIGAFAVRPLIWVGLGFWVGGLSAVLCEASFHLPRKAMAG